MKAVLIAFALAMGIGSVASPVLAANARHPYQNIDRRVDRGNPTGDDQVDRLNEQQLRGGGLGSSGAGMQGQDTMPMQGSGQGSGMR
jgi:hypothetical protein